MKLHPASGNRGPCWRCNGKIVSRNPTVKCCKGSRVSETVDSYFYNRSLKDAKVLEILYQWLSTTNRGEIARIVGVNQQSVRKVLKSVVQVLQEDLSLETDLRIGKPLVYTYIYINIIKANINTCNRRTRHRRRNR